MAPAPEVQVLHVPFTYAPDPMGGTEVYVARLASSLRNQGIGSVVAAPGTGREPYEVDGLPVHRFEPSSSLALADLYGPGDAAAASALGEIMDRVKPDVVHFHALTSTSSTRAQDEAIRRRIPVVFTYHTPSVTCQRGTLLLDGQSACDGVMQPIRCASCALQARGLGSLAAACIANMPKRMLEMIGQSGLSGGIWTAIQFPTLIGMRHESVRTFIERCHAVVITAEWVARVMERNGLAAQTLVMSPQGVPATSTTTRARPLVSGGPLRIAWLGRLNPAKGLHVLVQALALIPELQIRLDAYALREGDNGEYFRQLRQGLAQDPRIRLLPAVAPDEVDGTLANYDVVAVPSQGYETGPLVVLEAFASGIPVLGSALGGIAALVTDQETGLLVDPLRPDAWARAISDVYHDRTRLHRMMKNIVAPRTTADVARDMAALYRKTIMEYSETQEMAPKQPPETRTF